MTFEKKDAVAAGCKWLMSVRLTYRGSQYSCPPDVLAKDKFPALQGSGGLSASRAPMEETMEKEGSKSVKMRSRAKNLTRRLWMMLTGAED